MILSAGARALCRERHPHLTISKTVFKQSVCSCIREPDVRSRSSVTTSGLCETMQTLCQFHSQNALFKESIDSCSWPLHLEFKTENFLKDRPGNLCEVNTYKPMQCPSLKCETKTPKLICPKRVQSESAGDLATPKCAECGLRKFCMLARPAWNTNHAEKSYIAWEEAERSDGKSQLEPVENVN